MGTDPALPPAQQWWVVFFTLVSRPITYSVSQHTSVISTPDQAQGFLARVRSTADIGFHLWTEIITFVRLHADLKRPVAHVAISVTTDTNHETSYSFSPIKALRTLPRLWERKPATPFRSGPKSKKLWKRFHSSFSNMQSLQSSATADTNAFNIAINSSKEQAQVRGVKRLRVDDGSNDAEGASKERDVSFFETQWEPDSRKRRKLPDAPINIFQDKSQDYEGDWAMTDSPRPLSSVLAPAKTNVFLDGAADSDEQVKAIHTSGEDAQTAVNNATNDETTQTDTTAPKENVENLTQEQEGTLVRSALRSSLDGDDRELLNSFVSRAQAKRAAKAIISQELDTEKSSSPEEAPEAKDLTPRSRKVLETLDTNSPSPVKVQVSPSKGETIPGDEAQESEQPTEQTEEASAGSPNPTARRSTRVKVPAIKTARNTTISLRRAKGNEFIFVQRTEAQQLALATKQHTRQNRGDSVSPKYVLEMMANGDYDDDATDGAGVDKNRKTTKKSVTWNDARLVEFEDDVKVIEDPVEPTEKVDDDATGSTKPRSKAKRPEKKPLRNQRTSRSQAPQDTDSAESSGDSENGPTTLAAASGAASRSRRVRRLGESSMISGTPVKTGSGRLSKPPPAPAPNTTAGPSTPTKARRKLVPKSPSSSMLPVSKMGATDQSFVSGIPTRSGSSAGNSEGSKRSTALQASAGCTPMPRRVRARS